MAEKNRFEFTIKSDLKYLPFLRQMISGIALDHSNDKHFAHKCAVVLTEAVDNAVIHAHKRIKKKPIKILVEANEKNVAIEVWDQGDGFEMKDEAKWPSLLATSGRGIEIIRTLSREMTYEKNGEGNCLKIVVEK